MRFLIREPHRVPQAAICVPDVFLCAAASGAKRCAIFPVTPKPRERCSNLGRRRGLDG
jgi:hypothetical protein